MKFSILGLLIMDKTQAQDLNILGTLLEKCSDDPKTGFFRDGYCNTGNNDHGRHVICAQMTNEFLQMMKNDGNDLITPKP